MDLYILVKKLRFLAFLSLASIIVGCSNTYPTLPSATIHPSATESSADYHYLIGPNDILNVFVWRNPEISGSFIVRPDGKISTPLVDDIDVAGLKSSEVSAHIAEVLSEFIRDPKVTVSVTQFSGPFSEQVRVVGEAANPIAVSFREHMTVLDLMIQVGGLTDYADGNGAVLIRTVNSQQKKYSLRLNDLVKNGDITANVDMLPGDIVIIPEAWF